MYHMNTCSVYLGKESSRGETSQDKIVDNYIDKLTMMTTTGEYYTVTSNWTFIY